MRLYCLSVQDHPAPSFANESTPTIQSLTNLSRGFHVNPKTSVAFKHDAELKSVHKLDFSHFSWK